MTLGSASSPRGSDDNDALVAGGGGGGEASELPLFPLRTVLFPGALLELKIFEARYLDLVARCMRERSSFGVVALRSGNEARSGGGEVALHEVGTCVELLEVDAIQAGLLTVRARGTRRFALAQPRQERDGLWVAKTSELPTDAAVAPASRHQRVVEGLDESIQALAARGLHPFLEPFELGSAGWVANRWAELLPMPLEIKQRLLVTVDPLARLDLVAATLASYAEAGKES